MAFFWMFGWAWVGGPMAVTELFWRRVALLRSIVALGALLSATGLLLLICGAVVVSALS
jgi:hypothetical protein